MWFPVSFCSTKYDLLLKKYNFGVEGMFFTKRYDYFVEIRRAFGTGRARSSYHPLSNVACACSWCCRFSMRDTGGSWSRKCGPRWLPGGSSVAPWWIPVVGRNFFLMLPAWTGSTFSNLNGPRPPTWANLGQLATNNMHYRCHLTSTYHYWGKIFTFRPLSSIIFTKNCHKVAPRWPNCWIKSLKYIGKINVFEKRANVTQK